MENKTHFDWFAHVTTLKGVGPKIAQKLAKLQIHSLSDLLLHCPFRYEDRTRISVIKDLMVEQWALIEGKILNVQVKTWKGNKKRCQILLGDETGEIELIFFHTHFVEERKWQKGVYLRCFGQVRLSVKNDLGMLHPEYEIIDKDLPLPQYLTAVYASVAGLSQQWFRRIIHQLLSHCRAEDSHDQALPDFSNSYFEALQDIHCPKYDADIAALTARKHPAYERLIREELLTNYLAIVHQREKIHAYLANPLHLSDEILQKFLNNLPYTLTQAQNKVWREIHQDLAGKKPSLRLIQGDVGCGKTVVSALAALAAVASQQQVAIMVPTELLAEQHFAQFQSWFSALGYRCDLLVSKLNAKAKRSVLENITLGLSSVIIGTHALFQENVRFKSLGLIIIDEQHRFGVQQRFLLHQKGKMGLGSAYPHQLMMTATPIPRTLAMSQYAHLDISVIDSLPPLRQAITTLVIPQARRQEVIERMQKICLQGQQVYWVCTLIEDSEVLQSQAAQTTVTMLQQSLPEYKIGLIHGRMESERKESVMQAFYQGELTILVATTVIEVGVNVPNATLMIIENPERLGLAQCHQLRGRVGRGKEASFCILLYQPPLSEKAQCRLKTLRETQDGFEIAEADLALRGPGEILGQKQTGICQYRIADLKRDQHLLSPLPEWREKWQSSLSLTQMNILFRRWGIPQDLQKNN